MITIYTDGSSHPDGRGGAAAILRDGTGRYRAVSASWSATTNQRMELQAAIIGLEALKPITRLRRLPVTLVSDSEYVVKGITDWIFNWKLNDWKNSGGKPVANQDLWLRLDAAVEGLDIQFRHVRGHTGEPGNEEVHRLAEEAMRAA